MAALIDVILPVFLLLGFGYAMVWRGWFSDAGVDGLMVFTQRFAIPLLLFRAISEIDLGASLDWRLLGPYYAGALICFFVGLYGARALFGRPWPDAVAIGFVCLFSNSLLIGLSITERAYGPDALDANYAIIAFHSPFCYAVGILAMELVRAGGSGAGGFTVAREVLKAMFSNALVIGITAGFIVNIFAIQLPGTLSEAVDMMVRTALPAALFALGGVLYRYRPEGDMRTVAFVVSVSLVLHPALVWGMGNATGLSTDAMRSAVITAAAAPGVNTYVFADMYGVARRVVATSVLVGTAACILTAWVWLTILP